MTSAARAPSVLIEWHPVSSRHLCPVCGASRGCRFQASDAFACCVNSRSEWPLVNGAWLHKIVLDESSPASLLGGGRQ